MDSSVVNTAHLRSFVERIMKLREEVTALNDDIADVYKEAHGTGFDKKAIRQIVAIKSKDPNKRREEEEILDLYLAALGMVD